MSHPYLCSNKVLYRCSSSNGGYVIVELDIRLVEFLYLLNHGTHVM
jgi:hypothetical protein